MSTMFDTERAYQIFITLMPLAQQAGFSDKTLEEAAQDSIRATRVMNKALVDALAEERQLDEQKHKENLEKVRKLNEISKAKRSKEFADLRTKGRSLRTEISKYEVNTPRVSRSERARMLGLLKKRLSRVKSRLKAFGYSY